MSTKQSFTDPIKVPALKSYIPLPISALEKSVGECFADVAGKFPDKLAVVDPNQEVTYRSLDQKANRLARAIQTMKYSREVPITFVLGRTGDAIVTILGILKAGRIYVALDPSNPIDYLKNILNDARPSLIITNTSQLELARKLSSQAIPILNLDELAPTLLDTNLGESPSSNSLAAIFYTSGSTGKPKGVVLDHRALLHRAMVHINLHYLTPEDRSPLPFSLSFAWSITPMFSSLLAGGTLYPCNYTDMQFNGLIEWLNKNKISILHISSNLLRQFLASLSDGDQGFPYIRLVNAGSDVLYPQDVETWKRFFRPGSILAYGLASTETGTIARKFFNDKYKTTGNNLTVGYPPPHVKIKIIDNEGVEVGPNEIGEITIHSASMIRGYWGQTGLDHQFFLQNEQDPAQNFYHTGDLGSFRPDGALEFLGRKDNQFKIRGYRVNTAEITAILARHPAIKDVFIAVKTMQHANAEKRLIAFIVPKTENKPQEKELRDFLVRQLPEYMLPARFVFLDRLPYNTHGKVEVDALPEPPNQQRGASIDPHDGVEKLIAKIWCGLLQIESVGVEDNFFELGGDSLLALSMVLEVEKQTAQTVNQAFFQQATIAHLMEILGGGKLLQGTGKMTPQGKKETPQLVAGLSKKSASNLERRKTMRKLASKRFWQDGFILIPIFHKRTILSRSYIQGNRWLSEWCRRPMVVHGIYQAKYELFSKMIASLDGCTVNPIAAFPTYLMGNILQGTINNVLNVLPEDYLIGVLDKLRKSTFPYCSSLVDLIDNLPLNELDKYFSVMGLEYLERAYRESHGVIILTYHSTMNMLAIAALPRRLNCDPIQTISHRVAARQIPLWQNSKTKDIPLIARAALNAGEALRGQNLLAQGKIIQIVSDGDFGASFGTHRFIIAGRQYFLPPGFAELALNTGAIIVPQYSTILANGHIHTTFLPPFVAEPGNRDIQIERLMTQYSDFLSSSWRAAPESMNWQRIQKHFKYAVATEEN